jgi:hypothetical protein
MVLEGALKTLAARPDCFIEVHVGLGLEKFGGSVRRILDFFPSGYRFFAAPPETSFLPLEEIHPQVFENRFFLIGVDPERQRPKI